MASERNRRFLLNILTGGEIPGVLTMDGILKGVKMLEDTGLPPKLQQECAESALELSCLENEHTVRFIKRT